MVNEVAYLMYHVPLAPGTVTNAGACAQRGMGTALEVAYLIYHALAMTCQV